jgi:hypothetical protein
MTLTWNYNPTNGFATYKIFAYSQRDWNQTLLTKINELSRLVYINSVDSKFLYCSSNIKELLETLLYYNHKTLELGGYTIKYMDSTKNQIFVREHGLQGEYHYLNIIGYGDELYDDCDIDSWGVDGNEESMVDGGPIRWDNRQSADIEEWLDNQTNKEKNPYNKTINRRKYLLIR